ncbi:MAG: ABC transporter permease subunit [Planctomycetes bacterium]|nr:ABC transporter permease subunit [Planctomycetota bacterium]
MSDQPAGGSKARHLLQRSPRDLLQRMGRLVRKEVSTILRDRRTIITLVLMPLLLYPLLTIAFRQFLLASSLKEMKEPAYRIGFRSEWEARFFDGRMERGKRALAELKKWNARQGPASGRAREATAGNGRAEKPLPDHQALFPRTGEPPSDLRQLLQEKQIDLAVHLTEQDTARAERGPDRWFVCEILYLEDSPRSRDANEYVERCLAAANERTLWGRPKPQPAPRQPLAVLVSPVSQEVAQPGPKETIPLSLLVPLILILMTITGAVYPAIDLTAGERERGTLEILVAAPIPRLGLLFAKYVSVVTVAVLTAVVNLATMTVTLLVFDMGRLVFPEGLRPLAIVQVFFLLLLFAAFFSAVLLAVTSFARSFKEAQAYLIPLILVSLTPGMLSLMPGLKLDGPLCVVPLLNIVLLARDLFAGEATAGAAVLVVLTTLVYAVAAIALAARLFGAEAVLYNEQASWSDLFRRPARGRRASTVSSALFCLALMFPASFVLIALIGGGRPPGEEMAWRVLANLVLFGGFPLFSVWLRRVDFRAGFRLERSGAMAWGAAILFGLSLWPLADVLKEVLRPLGLTSVSEKSLQEVEERIRQWREELPVWVVVLCMAVVPAVLEELFFRGYLFSALRAAGPPRTAIVTSAIFFGLFHLVGHVVVVERGVVSTLLGLLLGWLAWRTGSVVPGMILHAIHNSVLILLGLYKRDLLASGWLQESSRLPPSWILASVIGCTLAAAWAFRATRNYKDEG